MKDLVIIFDLDDTLILEEPLAKKAFLTTCALAEDKYGISRYSLYETARAKSKELWYSYDTKDYVQKIAISSWEALWGDFSGDDENLGKIRGFIDDYRLNTWRNALLEHKIDDLEFSKVLADKFVAARSALSEFFPESLSVLKRLARNYRLGLITNGAPGIQRAKIRMAGIKKYFDHIIISGEIGMSKPNAGIFFKALDAFHTTKDRVIYIGNNLRSDVAGAKNAGLYTVWINRGKKENDGTTKPDAAIVNLKKIYKIIKAFSSRINRGFS